MVQSWEFCFKICRALFIKPHLLLLDEPTNHLDLEACVWLEEELKNYKQILVLISHSQVSRLFEGKRSLYGSSRV